MPVAAASAEARVDPDSGPPPNYWHHAEPVNSATWCHSCTVSNIKTRPTPMLNSLTSDLI